MVSCGCIEHGSSSGKTNSEIPQPIAKESAQVLPASKRRANGTRPFRGLRGTSFLFSFVTATLAIVTNAARALFAEQPGLINPGGNAYTSRRMAACLRDMEIILRYVTYAIFTGDASVLEDRCLNGLRETYLALGTPGASVAVGVAKMKEAAIAIANDPNGITSGDCTSLMAEIGTYFDRAAAAVA